MMMQDSTDCPCLGIKTSVTTVFSLIIAT